jgi:hypothetical protein
LGKILLPITALSAISRHGHWRDQLAGPFQRRKLAWDDVVQFSADGSGVRKYVLYIYST